MAASLASSMAQSNVYSLNVVGYYNVTVPANGFYMVANQLNTTNNSLASLLPNVADGSQLFKYNGGYSAYVFDGIAMAWGGGPPDPTVQTLNPGEGAFFRDAVGGTGQVLTFVGEVEQGSLANTLPVGNAVRSSMVPQAGLLTTDLGVPPDDGDIAFVYSGGYSAYVYDGIALAWGGTLPGGGSVDAGGPPIAVGQGFFYKKVTGGLSTSWVRNFTVQ
jgi:hypothetical protein